MENKKHEILEQKMCKELDTLEEKYRGGAELSENDLKRMDMIYHTLKSKATYDAMKEADEYNMYGGASYENRSMNNYSGRYYSRDMGPGGSGYSGHYPIMPRPYYDDRQW